jgi:hypothetical protein
MAIMNDEVVEPSVPFRAAATFSAAHHRPRDLDERELDEVAGGVGLPGGALGAAVGGLAGGFAYAMSTVGVGGFSWARFAGEVAFSAGTGLMIGSGAGLIHASLRGTMKGAHVLGLSMSSAGTLVQGIRAVPSQGGGSDPNE